MSSGNTTRSRLMFRRQGNFTSADTTYPATAPTAAQARLASNSIGVPIGSRYVGEDVPIRLTGTRAGGAASCSAVVYGYIDRYQTAADPSVDTSLQAWDHLGSLNNGSAITTTTDAVASVNVINHTSNGFRYNENFKVGGMYERILVIVVDGTFDSVLVDVGTQVGG